VRGGGRGRDGRGPPSPSLITAQVVSAADSSGGDAGAWGQDRQRWLGLVCHVWCYFSVAQEYPVLFVALPDTVLVVVCNF
jgi:hypothetical protein